MNSFLLLLTITFTTLANFSSASPRILALVKTNPIILKYHKGALLKGNITINLIWYGKFTPPQRSIIIDFIQSLNHQVAPLPSVSSWWRTTANYVGGPRTLTLGKQILDHNYSLGKSLKETHIAALASKLGVGPTINFINFVLTDADVAVEDFCMNRCGTHGYTRGKERNSAYAWVGNSGRQCPGQCAWPFAKPIVGPQTTPLVAPNGDVGVDGMVINLATVLAGTVTNPFDGGYFQGPATAPLEAVTACTGIFGSGAFPGYPGKVLVDKASGASYNARGVDGRKYLLPAMWDPKTTTCKPLL
ncbi:hypothetical protein RD792_000609 [Penstemon davidsonii]|uniref:Protein EXORDIUM-like 2 n=1 Tax=Penstemon davidsonii TaxID=160366 RepID=A0ABR0DLV7_9LAMI|nr:hypothetical protein RD792_000609 [Penstemon davidsonii]